MNRANAWAKALWPRFGRLLNPASTLGKRVLVVSWLLGGLPGRSGRRVSGRGRRSRRGALSASEDLRWHHCLSFFAAASPPYEHYGSWTVTNTVLRLPLVQSCFTLETCSYAWKPACNIFGVLAVRQWSALACIGRFPHVHTHVHREMTVAEKLELKINKFT